MRTRDIVEKWNAEMKKYKDNIVYNDCDICKKIFIQKWPYEVCDECKDVLKDIF